MSAALERARTPSEPPGDRQEPAQEPPDDTRVMNPAASAAQARRGRVARSVAVLAVAALALSAARAPFERWPVAQALALARGTGYVACSALLCALAVTPLAALVRSHAGARPWLPLIRRALGMAAAWLALVHALAAYVGPLGAQPTALVKTSHLCAGLGALGILVLLLLTSYARVVRALRLRAWKPMHRLSYVALLLVVQHVLLSPFADPRLVLALASLALLLFVARLLAAWRNVSETRAEEARPARG